jgi:hypothetical protein
MPSLKPVVELRDVEVASVQAPALLFRCWLLCALLLLLPLLSVALHLCTVCLLLLLRWWALTSFCRTDVRWLALLLLLLLLWLST